MVKVTYRIRCENARLVRVFDTREQADAFIANGVKLFGAPIVVIEIESEGAAAFNRLFGG